MTLLRDWTLECRPRKGQNVRGGRPAAADALAHPWDPAQDATIPDTFRTKRATTNIHAGTTGGNPKCPGHAGSQATSSLPVLGTLITGVPGSQHSSPSPLPSPFPGLVSLNQVSTRGQGSALERLTGGTPALRSPLFLLTSVFGGDTKLGEGQLQEYGPDTWGHCACWEGAPLCSPDPGGRSNHPDSPRPAPHEEGR